MEANSPLVRENCWDWYTSVVRTRMHNASSELIVFTRWHDEDLIGELRRRERCVDMREWSDLDRLGDGDWLCLNFEALKCSPACGASTRAARARRCGPSVRAPRCSSRSGGSTRCAFESACIRDTAAWRLAAGDGFRGVRRAAVGDCPLCGRAIPTRPTW